MAIISERDQAIVNAYNNTVQTGFAGTGPGTPLGNIPVYRKVMGDIDDNYLAPPKFVATPVASFQAERVLRPNLTAAVSVPKGSGPFPILVHAHGHGLRAGHPNKYEPWIRLMSSYGFVVVFPDYRLQPESTYEDQVDDMNFAIQWAKDNARELKGNPDKMILGGDSAGGRMAFDVMMRHLDNPAGGKAHAADAAATDLHGGRQRRYERRSAGGPFCAQTHAAPQGLPAGLLLRHAARLHQDGADGCRQGIQSSDDGVSEKGRLSSRCTARLSVGMAASRDGPYNPGTGLLYRQAEVRAACRGAEKQYNAHDGYCATCQVAYGNPVLIGLCCSAFPAFRLASCSNRSGSPARHS